MATGNRFECLGKYTREEIEGAKVKLTEAQKKESLYKVRDKENGQFNFYFEENVLGVLKRGIGVDNLSLNGGKVEFKKYDNMPVADSISVNSSNKINTDEAVTPGNNSVQSKCDSGAKLTLGEVLEEVAHKIMVYKLTEVINVKTSNLNVVVTQNYNNSKFKESLSFINDIKINEHEVHIVIKDNTLMIITDNLEIADVDTGECKIRDSLKMLNTSNLRLYNLGVTAESLNSMFSQLKKLEAIEYYNMDFSGVTDLQNILKGCKRLRRLEFHNCKSTNIKPRTYHALYGTHDVNVVDAIW